MKNWWYYHKWYVICGVLLFLITFHLISNAFGWFHKAPDVQIAYVGEEALSAETESAVIAAFSSMADDYNQDGEIFIQVNQYVSGSPTDHSAEGAQIRQAAEIRLVADINDCESFFFLMDQPEEFQKKYQILALEDGSCPKAHDFSVSDKLIPWDSSLSLGRRCFYDSRTTEHAEECAFLWDTLKGTN